MKDLKSFLNKNYIFYYNVLGDDYLYTPKKNKKDKYIDLKLFKPLDDRARNSILVRYIEEKNDEISATKLDRLIESDFTKEINPFEVYINNLVPSNGESEFEKLLKTIKTEHSEYFKWAFKKWLVAFIACALEEDVSNHAMLILVGKQGIGKSTWCKNLLPPELKYYFYSGMFSPNDKDHLAYLSDKLIINVDELSGYNKKTLDSFKEIISKADYSIRRPYGRRNSNFIRRASFIGSSNNNDILIDLTGNRRFLCVEVESIDYSTKINYDALYSEMYKLYSEGFKYWFDEEDILQIEKQNENFAKRSVEEDIILNYVINNTKISEEDIEKYEFEWLTVTDLINKLHLHLSRGYRVNDSLIGKILTKEKFAFKKVNGTRKYHLCVLDKISKPGVNKFK